MLGYRRQVNRKTLEGSCNSERNPQFEPIRRCRHDTAMAMREGLIGGKQPPAALVEKFRRLSEAGPDDRLCRSFGQASEPTWGQAKSRFVSYVLTHIPIRLFLGRP